MAKKKRTKTKLKNNWKTLVAVLLLIFGIWFLSEGGLSPTTRRQPQVQEEVAQLSSPDEDYEGSAMVSRSTSREEFRLSLTAFLENTTDQASYGVWISNEEDTMFLGELQKAGDVYTINFRSESNLNDYSRVTIAELADDEEMGDILLTGSF